MKQEVSYFESFLKIFWAQNKCINNYEHKFENWWRNKSPPFWFWGRWHVFSAVIGPASWLTYCKKIPLCTCVIDVASPVSCFNVVKELFSNAENTHRWNSVTFCQIVHLLRSPSDTVVQLIPIKLFDLFPSTTPQWIIRLTDVCILPVHTY